MQLLFYSEHVEFEYIKLISSIQVNQINLKKEDAGWSILEIIEHVNLVENNRTKKLLEKVQEIPLKEAQFHFQINELLEKISNRKEKILAPEMFIPQGKIKTIEEGLKEFKVNRINLKSIIVNNNDEILKKHVLPHPRLGNLNIKEWIYFLNGHLQRHTEQINEIL